MVVISYAGREANAKIVYYGPGLGGKTSNLEFIYDSVPSSSRGKMVSMKTQTDRTLFFDFLPLDLGELGGFRTRFLLYTVPGQVFYNATRKLVLRGADAIAFIADSQVGKMDENKESLANLEENLAEYDLSLDSIPWVIQYNKRDLPEVYSIEELNRELNARNVPYFEGIATEGVGVFETFRGLSKLLLEKLSEEIGQRLVMAKDAGTKAADERAKAVEKILSGPTEHVEIPEVGRVAEPAAADQAAPMEEVAPEPGPSEPFEGVEELEPQVTATDESFGYRPETQAPVEDFVEAAPVEEAPLEIAAEPERVILERKDLVAEPVTAWPTRAEEAGMGGETPEPNVDDSAQPAPEAPEVELLREHEAVPDFFTRSLQTAKLELERDTAHFAETHEYALDAIEPKVEATREVESRPVEQVARRKPTPEPVPTRPVTPPATWAESTSDEEPSFLNIIRRNNVGVFEKTGTRSAAAPGPAPAPVSEPAVEKRNIESSIEIPLPLKQGERMEEVTLTIKIRLKPVPQASGATEREFILDGISR